MLAMETLRMHPLRSPEENMLTAIETELRRKMRFWVRVIRLLVLDIDVSGYPASHGLVENADEGVFGVVADVNLTSTSCPPM